MHVPALYTRVSLVADRFILGGGVGLEGLRIGRSLQIRCRFFAHCSLCSVVETVEHYLETAKLNSRSSFS